MTGQSVEEVLASHAGQGFGTFKPALADAAIALLAPLRERLIALRTDPASIDAFLAAGAERAAGLGGADFGRGLSRGRPDALKQRFIDGSPVFVLYPGLTRIFAES